MNSGVFQRPNAPPYRQKAGVRTRPAGIDKAQLEMFVLVSMVIKLSPHVFSFESLEDGEMWLYEVVENGAGLSPVR